MNARTSLSCIVALGAALSAPLAFAQEADPAAADAAQATQAATPAPEEAKKISWSDLDADKDGNLTKTEAATVPSLTDVFDQADADTDGSLTPDEYKNYLAKNGQSAQPNGQG